MYDIIIGRDESDKKIFGERGLIFLGKGYVKMGQYTSLSNKIFMDIARSHVVLVSGKRGSGKCLHEDTLISLADGSQIPIKYLENNQEKIFSLNSQLKINGSERTEFFSREVDKILKIKLRSGKEIKLTPEHPLLTIKGWKPVQELTIGSRIATPRKILFGKEEIPYNQVKILAYLLAEGHLSNNFCLFSNKDEKIISEFKECVNLFDSNLKVDIHSKEGCFRISQKNKKYKIGDIKRNEKGQFRDNNIKYEKSSMIKWLIDLGIYGRLSAQKFIPEKVMKLKREQISIFLNRLFSCDGSIYCKKTKTGKTWQISYASSSEKMIRQVQSLLLRFEILSRLRDRIIRLNGKEFKSFELILNAENVLRFIEEIGFFGKKEERVLKAKQHIISVKRNQNVDTIPREVWNMYGPFEWAKIGKDAGYKYPKAMRERIFYSPTRQNLLQIAQITQKNPLQLLATSDIFWDEIVSMEIIEGKFNVYDICVPENHNFVANDIIVHNSYTLGVIAEELSNLPPETSRNIASLIFDTMGIYWTMKFENEKDRKLLQDWGLKAKNLPVKVFVPFGHYEKYLEKGIPIDEKFALDIKELTPEDWIVTFGLDIINPVSILIQRTLSKLKEREGFEIKDIISFIEQDEKTSNEVKNAAIGMFEAAEEWGIFAKGNEKPTEVKDLVSAGTTSVLDLSIYNSVGAFNIRALVISLVSRKIFNQRMDARKAEEMQSVSRGMNFSFISERKENPLVWMFIDEAHEFLPLNGKTAATDALVQLLREGRQPGISVVLATQQPGQIHRDVMTQSDIVISHRVTSQPDLEALNFIMQSYLLQGINAYMNDLPALKGSAIILDDNSERIYPIRVKPRFTWHGGEAPTAVSYRKEM